MSEAGLTWGSMWVQRGVHADLGVDVGAEGSACRVGEVGLTWGSMWVPNSASTSRGVRTCKKLNHGWNTAGKISESLEAS